LSYAAQTNPNHQSYIALKTSTDASTYPAKERVDPAPTTGDAVGTEVSGEAVGTEVSGEAVGSGVVGAEVSGEAVGSEVVGGGVPEPITTCSQVSRPPEPIHADTVKSAMEAPPSWIQLMLLEATPELKRAREVPAELQLTSPSVNEPGALTWIAALAPACFIIIPHCPTPTSISVSMIELSDTTVATPFIPGRASLISSGFPALLDLN